jgi:hypothetical protein
MIKTKPIKMDLLHALHLVIFGLLVSIPLWPIAYLRYGVYVPIVISIIWVIFNGCPLTKVQTNLSSNSFTKEVYKHFMPNISVNDAKHINTFALLFITVVGFYRLNAAAVCL